MGKISDYLSGMNKSTKLGLAGALAFIGIAGAASVGTPDQQASCTPQTITSTQTQVIPYSNSNADDPTIAKGQTKVTTQGVNGEKAIEHTVTTYTPDDCKPSTDEISKEIVTLQPINQVTAVGTYVAPPPPPTPSCSNGSYVNSAGNTVCSPSNDSNGASARCADGTYSYSQSRRGTCSHHGGVAVWY